MPPDQDDPSDESGPGAKAKQTLTGIGLFADIAGIVALVASGAVNFALTVGILTIVGSALLLAGEWGKPLKSRTLAMVLSLALGIVLTGAAAVYGLSQSAPQTTDTAQGDRSAPSVEPLPGESTADTAYERRRTTPDSPLVLSRGYSADLDADAVRSPDWKVKYSASDSSYDILLTWALGGALSAEAAPVEGEPSFEVCRSATGYSSSIRPDVAIAGFKACVRTSEDRLAYVLVRNVAENRRSISLDVVVWDPPVAS